MAMIACEQACGFAAVLFMLCFIRFSPILLLSDTIPPVALSSGICGKPGPLQSENWGSCACGCSVVGQLRHSWGGCNHGFWQLC